MSAELLLTALLVLAGLIFGLQCIVQLGLKLDAGYVLGFSMFFDAFGYLYRQSFSGNTLLILVGAPFLVVLTVLLQKPFLLLDMFSNKGIWLWLLFFLYCTVSFAWAPGHSAGLTKELLLLIRGVIPGIYTYVLYARYGKLSWTVVAVCGFSYAAVHLMYGQYTAEFPGRLTLPGDNPIFNARLSLLAALVGIWGRKIPWPVRIAVIGAGVVSAAATQSRGPMAAFVVVNLAALCIWLYRLYKLGEIRRLKRYISVLSAALVLTGGIALLYQNQLAAAVGGSRFSVIISASKLQSDDNYAGRVDLQGRAFETFQQHPLFGVGIGGSTPPVEDEFPHHIVLELASELGAAGLGLWIMACLFSVLAVYVSEPVLALLILQSLGCAMLSGDLGYNYEYMLFAWTALSYVLVREARKRRETADEEHYVSNYRI